MANYPSKLMLKTMEIAEWMRLQGIKETTGNNDHPMIEYFLERVDRQEGDAWCAAFVYACIEMAGFAIGRYYPPIKKSGLVYSIWQDAIKSKAFLDKGFITNPKQLKYGAIFIMQYGDTHRGHTGFVRGALDDGKTILTLEGNSGNRVRYWKRSINSRDLLGFIYYP